MLDYLKKQVATGKFNVCGNGQKNMLVGGVYPVISVDETWITAKNAFGAEVKQTYRCFPRSDAMSLNRRVTPYLCIIVPDNVYQENPKEIPILAFQEGDHFIYKGVRVRVVLALPNRCYQIKMGDIQKLVQLDRDIGIIEITDLPSVSR